MTELAKLKNLLNACIERETSKKVYFFTKIKYSDFFIKDDSSSNVLIIKHDFPFPSLKFLSPSSAEAKICQIYEDYNQRSLWGKFKWHIFEHLDESIADYEQFYRIIHLKKLLISLKDAQPSSRLELYSFIHRFLIAVKYYFSSNLPGSGFFDAIFEEPYMHIGARTEIDLYSLIHELNYVSCLSFLKAIENEENTSQLINSTIEWINKINAEITKLPKSNVIYAVEKQFLGISRLLFSFISKLEYKTQSNDISVLAINDHLRAQKAFDALQTKLNKLKNHCVVYTNKKMWENLEDFTYNIQLDRNGKLKTIVYYENEHSKPQKISDIFITPWKGVLINDENEELNASIYQYHLTHTKLKDLKSPIETYQAIMDLSSENVINELIQKYSVELAASLAQTDVIIEDTKPADLLINYYHFILAKNNAYMQDFNNLKAQFQSAKNDYVQVLRYIDNNIEEFQKHIVNYILINNDRSGHAPIIGLDDWLTTCCDGFAKLSPLSQRQIKQDIKSKHAAWLDLCILIINPDTNWWDDGLIRPSVSTWHKEIKNKLSPNLDKDTANQKSAALLISLMKNEPIYSYNQKLAFKEILFFKQQACKKLKSSDTITQDDGLSLVVSTASNPPKPIKFTISNHSLFKEPAEDSMPVDSDIAWAAWISQALKQPATLETKLHAMNEHIKVLTKDPVIDLLRYTTISILAVRWVEAVKWKHAWSNIKFDVNPEEAAIKVKELLGVLWKKIFSMHYHPDKNNYTDQESQQLFLETCQKINNDKDEKFALIDAALKSNIYPVWISEGISMPSILADIIKQNKYLNEQIIIFRQKLQKHDAKASELEYNMNNLHSTMQKDRKILEEMSKNFEDLLEITSPRRS